MPKLNFHDFYDYIWEDEVLEIIVSTKYISENEDFIKQLTLDIYRLYEFSELPNSYFKKFIEIMFTNLFIYKPKTSNIKEIKDSYPDVIGYY